MASPAGQRWAYWTLVLVFTFAGLTGHDPWKADEAYVFGVVQHMQASADWVVPELAGEPFMEKPPLFYWVASAFASSLSRWLPLHDGARLASGFFMLLACWAVAAAAKIWWGGSAARYAALALIACLGPLVQSHMMMPDLPLLAGFALSALGCATIPARPRRGGVLLGLGIGIGFLAKGLLAPAVIGLTTLILPLCFKAWRTRPYWRGLLIAAIVSLPWCAIWPVLLYRRAPALFMDWFWINNVGRFLGFSVARLGTEHLPWFWTQTIPWFTFPSLPLALWVLWRRRRTAWSEPPIQYALVAFAVLMLVLAVSSSGRSVYAWPLLVPIAIVAAPGAAHLPRRCDAIWAWLSLLLFGALCATTWGVWASMMRSGMPPDWPQLLRWLPATFVPRFDGFAVLAATLATAAAWLGLRMAWQQPARGLTVWVVGITLSWSLLMTLWLPWLDFAKSYRSVFASMPVPADSNCIASINLGEGERAMLKYITGRNPVRVEVSPAAGCTTLLVQREAAFGEPGIDPSRWQELWRGARPGVTNERFWLFRRNDDAGPRPPDAGPSQDSAAALPRLRAAPRQETGGAGPSNGIVPNAMHLGGRRSP